MHAHRNKVLVLLALFVFLFAVGGSNQFVSPFASTASLTSGSAYGEQLGKTVDDVVNTILATVPEALITHADVLTVMCMEQGGANPNLRTTITSGAGAKGLTQVMPGTFAQYKQTGRGGFRYLGCSYSEIQTNPRCAIESGARIFNDLLMRYDGNRTTAARAYNGGPGRAYGNLPAETRNYAYNKLPQCWNTILAGKSPVASSVWRAMIQEVSALTNGTFKLSGEGTLVPLEASGWTNVASNPQQRLQDLARGWFQNNSKGGNPIASFLGIPQSPQTTGGVSRTSPGYSSPGSSPTSGTEGDLGRRSGGSFAPERQSTPGFVSGSAAGAEPVGENLLPNQTSPLKPINFSNTPTSPASAVTTGSPVTIQNNTPTILCLPNPVTPGEEALILWACRDGAYKTTGENFNTNGDLVGKTRVRPTRDTTYTLNCINNTPAVDNTAGACTIQVVNPQLALIATPRSATKGDSVALSWKTDDITSCILTSNKNENFKRSGTEGDAISLPMRETTTFTLTCETTTGVVEERSVEVRVQ
tara:strand:- start:4046 stop:5638 length:1593 start_codon:yes stop_codon:yes gene_type:complete